MTPVLAQGSRFTHLDDVGGLFTTREANVFPHALDVSAAQQVVTRQLQGVHGAPEVLVTQNHQAAAGGDRRVTFRTRQNLGGTSDVPTCLVTSDTFIH